MKKTLLFLMLALTTFSANSQSDKTYETEYNRQRGYYDRPYFRFEAENGKCNSDGTFLEPTYNQTYLQSEASNQQAVQLTTQNSYVSWTNNTGKGLDGLTVRFSLPDGTNGEGTKGIISLFVNNVFVQDITLDSYWAWQWQGGGSYANNTPDPNYVPGATSFSKFARMRFDEIHLKLANKIPANATFKLVKKDNNSTPYTIDFVELEEVPTPVTFEDINDGNAIKFTGTTSEELRVFLLNNPGKTIYIPAGKYNVDSDLRVSQSNTKVIGAGMWHTYIYFTQDPTDIYYKQRGIILINDGTQKTNIEIKGISLNTFNNARYKNNTQTNTGTGKGLDFQGEAEVLIEDLWIEHFEAGAWIELAVGVHMKNCRIRSNYADGINLCRGTKNSIIEHCSFRNNGDDDIAIWPRNNEQCINNVIRYNTIENNWRASGLGIFGGQYNSAHHCLIIEGLDAGFRVTSEFQGAPFSDECYNALHDISVYNGGAKSGTRGIDGAYMGGSELGAFHLYAHNNGDIPNLKIYNIDLYNSKNDGIYISRSGSKKIINTSLSNINIYGAERYGIRFASIAGDITYCNIHYENCKTDDIFYIPSSGFSWTEANNCSTLTTPEDCNLNPVIDTKQDNTFTAYYENNTLIISGLNNLSVSIFDIIGRKKYQSPENLATVTVSDLPQGVYIIRLNNTNQVLKVTVNNDTK